MKDDKIKEVSTLALAHIGDALYDLMTRKYLVENGYYAVNKLHKETVARVNANYQAKVAMNILPILSPEELAVYKRGRNANVNSVPKGASKANYHASTGLETLFGYLELKGETARIEELFMMAMEVL